MTHQSRRPGISRGLALIDQLSTAMAAVSSMALLAMALIVGFEVASRYLFNSPTIWAWDVNVQLMVLVVMLSLAETFRRDDHVRVDLITARLSRRSRALLEILLAPVLLFTIGIVVWTSWDYAFQAWERGQRDSTIFAPLLWPIKFALPLGGALLMLQALAKLAADLVLVLGAAGDDDEVET